jgi:hypothetical protein
LAIFRALFCGFGLGFWSDKRIHQIIISRRHFMTHWFKLVINLILFFKATFLESFIDLANVRAIIIAFVAENVKTSGSSRSTSLMNNNLIQ